MLSRCTRTAFFYPSAPKSLVSKGLSPRCPDVQIGSQKVFPKQGAAEPPPHYLFLPSILF